MKLLQLGMLELASVRFQNEIVAGDIESYFKGTLSFRFKATQEKRQLSEYLVTRYSYVTVDEGLMHTILQG
jgi:hypothetical protein